MSMALMVKAMEIKVGNPLRKLVLIKLADNASDTGECWPSYQHIADQCEISKRSVINHIKALEEAGFLTIKKRKIDKDLNDSNIYLLNLNGSAGDSLGVVQEIHYPSAGDSLGGSAGAAPKPVTSLNLSKNNKKKNSSSIVPSDEFDKALIAYRKSIKKPLKTQYGLDGLRKNLNEASSNWNVELSKVFEHLKENEWQSINPNWNNPFRNVVQMKATNANSQDEVLFK